MSFNKLMEALNESAKVNEVFARTDLKNRPLHGAQLRPLEKMVPVGTELPDGDRPFYFGTEVPGGSTLVFALQGDGEGGYELLLGDPRYKVLYRLAFAKEIDAFHAFNGLRRLTDRIVGDVPEADAILVAATLAKVAKMETVGKRERPVEDWEAYRPLYRRLSR